MVTGNAPSAPPTPWKQNCCRAEGLGNGYVSGKRGAGTQRRRHRLLAGWKTVRAADLPLPTSLFIINGRGFALSPPKLERSFVFLHSVSIHKIPRAEDYENDPVDLSEVSSYGGISPLGGNSAPYNAQGLPARVGLCSRTSQPGEGSRETLMQPVSA